MGIKYFVKTYSMFDPAFLDKSPQIPVTYLFFFLIPQQITFEIFAYHKLLRHESNQPIDQISLLGQVQHASTPRFTVKQLHTCNYTTTTLALSHEINNPQRPTIVGDKHSSQKNNKQKERPIPKTQEHPTTPPELLDTPMMPPRNPPSQILWRVYENYSRPSCVAGQTECGAYIEETGENTMTYTKIAKNGEGGIAYEPDMRTESVSYKARTRLAAAKIVST